LAFCNHCCPISIKIGKVYVAVTVNQQIKCRLAWRIA